jgi:hypothetical protein
LVEDPDLAGDLDGWRLDEARRRCLAADVIVDEGDDRWGRVTPEGVRIPLRLRHHMLAELVAVRRPSATAAL